MTGPEEPGGPALRIGVGASPGIGVGRAYVLQRERLILPEYAVAADAIEPEVERLREGMGMARAQLEQVRQRAGGLELVDTILRTQVMILEDRQLFDDAVRRIRHECINAEWAVSQELRRLNTLFDAMESAYLRERRADVNFAVRQLLLCLLGREPEGLAGLSGPTVVVAQDLSPAETAQLDSARVVGLATDAGGGTSHTAIMANSLGIPTVVGLGDVTQCTEDGDLVIVDGRAGRVIARPDEATLCAYRERARADGKRQRNLLRIADLPAETRDGRRMTLLANIERPDEIRALRSHGAAGVGLFRTEFLYLNRPALPDEAEQTRHYRAVLESVAPGPASIRTVDLGGDKLPLAAGGRPETNPALGLRGVRLARADAGGIYRTQLRAMLRASRHGRLRVLLPLVTGVEEVRQARESLEAARTELEAEGVAMAAEVEVGLVVETPAAVALVDLLAPEVDYFSIGTNDLIQYTVAVDRENQELAYLYDPLHPAVLRAVRDVVERAHAAGRPVGLCGEMAGDPLYSLVLVGLGLDELSMNAPSIPRVKSILRATRLEAARALALELLTLSTAAETGDRLRKEMLRRFPHEFEGI